MLCFTHYLNHPPKSNLPVKQVPHATRNQQQGYRIGGEVYSAGCSASASNMLLVIEILVMREYNHLSYVVLRRNQFFLLQEIEWARSH